MTSIKVLGYEETDGYTTQTCSKHEELYSRQYQMGDLKSNLEACSSVCDEKIDCKYVFYNDNNWCAGHSTCDFGRTASSKGDIYIKRGNLNRSKWVTYKVFQKMLYSKISNIHFQ